jgi:hypothetical protein
MFRIRGRSPSHVPCVVLLSSDGTCVSLAIPYFPFLSFFPSLSFPVADLGPACKLKSHKFGVFLAIQISVSVGQAGERCSWPRDFERGGGQEGHKCHLERGKFQGHNTKYIRVTIFCLPISLSAHLN